MNFLILEDNYYDADLSKRAILTDYKNSTVDIAPSLDEARHLIASGNKYDLALLDMNLPDGNGLELLDEIRNSGISMAVVVFTASSSEELAVAALKAGADDYIAKKQDYTEKLPKVVQFALRSFNKKDRQKNDPINVLFIEHNTIDIDLTTRHLRKFAPRVHLNVLPTADDALDNLPLSASEENTSHYHMILMDYRLTGMGAFDFIKIIKQERELNIPIVLVTGQGDEEVAVQALKLGAADYVSKSENYLYRLPSIITSIYQRTVLNKKQTELAKSEGIKNKLLANIGDVIVIIDKNEINQYKSPNVEALFGWKPDELIGQNVWDIVHPEDVGFAKQFLDNLRLEAGAKGTMEVRYRRKDGNYVWIEITIVNLFHDEDILGFLGNYHDITGRKRAGQELKESEEMLRNSQSLAHICAYSTNLNLNELGKSTWKVSPEFYKVFGIDESYPHTLEGWAGFIHPDYREEMVAYHQYVVKERVPFNKEYKIIRINDGAERWVHGTGELVYNEKGKPVRMHGAIQDITGRKEAEKMLQEKNKEYERINEALKQANLELIAAKENVEESEEKLKSIFLVAPTGIGIVKNRTFIEVNPKVCEMTGYPSEELVGQSARILYPTQEDFEFVGQEKYKQIARHGTGTVETSKVRMAKLKKFF